MKFPEMTYGGLISGREATLDPCNSLTGSWVGAKGHGVGAFSYGLHGLISSLVCR